MYDFITGPLLRIALLLFVTGSLIKIYRSIMLLNASSFHLKKENFRMTKKNFVFGAGARKPFFTIITVLFHGILVMFPLFQIAHVMIIKYNFTVALPALPQFISQILAITALACGLILLMRRIFFSEIRAITSSYDYFLLLVTLLPFALGILAYHQVWHYKTLLSLHMLSGELVLVLLGWTKLGHMYHFIIARLFVATEFNNRRGGWQY